MTAVRVGLVAVDQDNKWIGGRYYLQHIVTANAAQPNGDRLRLTDVWWQERSSEDPFSEVREHMEPSVVLRYPQSFTGRLVRKARRTLRGSRGWKDARDLFQEAGIDVLFPILPCQSPGIPFVYWLPDFQYLHLPELFTPDLIRWYQDHYSSNVEAAKIVVLSSLDAKRDFVSEFPQHAGKARVLSFCSVPRPEWWSREPSEVARRYGLPEKFLIVSNQFSSHKNHLALFEAVRILKDRGRRVTLACTGSLFSYRGDDYPEKAVAFIEENGLGEQIRILGLIPREDQIALMRRSLAVLQPSRFEGWSTVVEDAKALGKCVVASDLAVHREQLGEGGSYCPTSDPEAWADAICRVWSGSSPGPAKADEAAAVARTGENQLQLGREFAEIIRQALN